MPETLRIIRRLGEQQRSVGGEKKLWRRWNGAQGRNRTTDTAIFSRMLYQLSYLGTPSPNQGSDNEAG
jgi:hypothetical protein